MPYKTILANDQVYHVFNRGVEKRVTFVNTRDYERFIETLNYYRFDNPPVRFSYQIKQVVPSNVAAQDPLVEIIAFCIMPNHFHLLIKQIKENGVSIFMSKITNSYTKYFNIKNNRVGPLFQGTFKAVRVEDDQQLIHTSRYIHLNPLTHYLVKDLQNYKFSSYLEYVGKKPGICRTEIVLDHFSSPQAYTQFTLDQEEYGRAIKHMGQVYA